MATVSPTLEGFRAALRWPSFTLGEMAWRWSAGATGIALFFFGLFEFLNTLPVSNGELLFLRSRQPYLVGQAISHILRGSLGRAVLSGLVATLLLGLLWIIAASVGRIATVRALLQYFRADFARRLSAVELPEVQEQPEVREPVNRARSPFTPLFDLNFLRVSVVLGGALGLIGAGILAGFASPSADPQPGLVFMLWLPMAALICLVCWLLNWFLSLAGLFAVRDGCDAIGAISAAVSFCRERTGAVAAVSTWTGLAHLAIFTGATTIAAMPLTLAGILPWRIVLLSVFVLTLAYFAIADWIYMARLAGYVCIAEMPEALLKPPPLPEPPPVAPPVQTTIDREELILSDVPHLIVET
jgi:hypothetical protein